MMIGKREKVEDADRYTVHAFPSLRIVAATSERLARSVIP
jgi:hypothetical protein